MDTLTLLVPGLGGNVGTAPINAQFKLVLDALTCDNSLDLWASMCSAGRLEQTPISGTYPAALGCAWFGIWRDSDSGTWPLSGLSWFADQPSNTVHNSKGCICIEPVHLEVAHSGLIASDPKHLALHMDEAKELSEIIAPMCNAAKITIHTPLPQRWYLTMPAAVRLQLTPLSATVGISDTTFLPQGKDAAQWMRWLNQVQLEWSNCKVNQRRQARGQTIVNSVWLSATGHPSHKPSRAPLPDLVSTDEPAIAGLANWCNIRCIALMDSYAVLEHTARASLGHALVLESGLYHAARIGDWSTWSDKLDQWTTHWLQPVWLAFRKRELQSLEIIDECGRRLLLNSGARRRWWHRRLPIGWWRIKP